MTQFPAEIDLASLDAEQGLKIAGTGSSDRGFSLALAGDVNGDGYDDLIIGSSGADHLVFGGAHGIPAGLDLADLDPTQGFDLSGQSLSGKVSSAGDFNGDGLTDLLVGGSGGPHNPDSAYVIFGSTAPVQHPVNVSALDGTNGFRLENSDNRYAQDSVTSAGDINGDGFSDIMVSSPYDDPGGGYGGTTYVVFGHAGPFAPTFDLADIDGHNGIKLTNRGGGEGFEYAGYSLASVDVNGDGFEDLLIGTSYSGYKTHDDFAYTYIVFGSASGFKASIELDGMRPVIRGNDIIAAAGDFNGDGIQDIVAGGANGGTRSEEYAHLVFGSSQLGEQPIEYDGHDGFAINAIASSVASAGDVNGDGFDDLLIGVSGGTGAPGKAYVIFGRAGDMPATFDLSSLNGSNGFEIVGAAPGDEAGIAVSSAGDVNHDGLDDIMVQADGADGGAGAAYIIYGQLPTDAVHRVGTVASQTLVGGDFDDVLSGKAGDDVLWGHKGDDTLLGGGGHDTLIGGNGADVLRGGGRKDVFLFNTLATSTNAAPDIIQDLGRDRINLKSIDADSTQAGDQAFHLVSAFTGHAGELALTWHASGAYAGYTTIQADVDGDGQADMTILVLGDHHDFSNFAL